MPRTKVSKSSKRNREVTNREEKVRLFENTLDEFQNKIDETAQDFLQSYEEDWKALINRTSSALLKLKFCDVFEIDFKLFANWEQQKSINASIHNSTLMKSAKALNPNDEGYLTEDSSTGGSIGSTTTNAAFLTASNMRSQQLIQQQTARLRTPGPLSSARSRRARRSRSACGDLVPIPGSAIKTKPQLTTNSAVKTERNSRSKMRTPMSSKTKSYSADRTTKANDENTAQSPPTFLRFPKPGELILSKCGSPLVTQTLPENFAHLNIPLRNGVISMRPKKLVDIQQHLIEDLDPITVDQLRTLKTNIDKILDKAGF